MLVRRATIEDKESILSLLDEIGEEINRTRGYSPHNAEASRVGGAMVEEVLARKDTMIFVASEKRLLVGMLSFYLLPNMRHGFYGGHVEDIVVTKALRGKGIGTKLFTALKKYCASHHISVIKLDSGIELPDAHRFYEHQGGKFTEKMFRFDL